MDCGKFKELLMTQGSKFVYNSVLLNEDVYLLREAYKSDAPDKYHEIKVATSDVLNVPVKNVAIVGSAKTGYSLTPGRCFAPFGPESDLDLVVVSDVWFRELWESYLQHVTSSTGRSYATIAKNIFRHFISIKAEDIKGDQLDYFSDWIGRVDRLRQTFQLNYKLPTEVNYRVYDNWSYVEKYHIAGLEALIGDL